METRDAPDAIDGEGTLRLAVLIDADNAQASIIEALLGEVARFGEAAVRRIYGDFTSPNSSQWKKVLNQHSIKPVQQFAYTKGKNATDSTMIIDAMDLMYTRRFDGFCLVSSDSDFTGLAVRIREEGLRVLGFGEEKTPEAFRRACHKFVFTEVLRDLPGGGEAPDQDSGSGKGGSTKASASAGQADAGSTAAQPTGRKLPVEFMLKAAEQASDESGWAQLGTFGSYLNKLEPDFDSRLYGFKKLSELVKRRTDIFQVDERKVPGGAGKVLYLKARNS